MAAALLVGLGSYACGSGDDDQPQNLAHDIHIHLDEWSVTPSPPAHAEGTVLIGGHNHGKYPHQVTVVETDLDPGSLPIEKGRVDLAAIGEPVVEFDVPAADDDEGTQVVSAEVTAGKYVIYCAIPGHYQQGMYAPLEITGSQPQQTE